MIIFDASPRKTQDGHCDTPDELEKLEKLSEAMEKQNAFLESWLDESPPVSTGRWLI